MERYKEYKDSVLPGMNAIPKHWKEILNGILFKENIRRPLENDIPLSLSQKDGLIPTDMMKESSLKTSSYDNWKRVVKHDLVLNRFKAHLGVLMASDYEGMVSFHYGVYEPQLPLVTKYYELLYHTDIYKGIYAYSSNGMTVGLQNLSNLAFYSIKGIYPPLAEQEKIVRYLEGKTSKIDAYVAEKEKEIQLLQELKQKTIADAVTKGLNPDVKMKDSGISWIGDIPEHWEMKQLRSFLTLFTEKGHGDAQLLSVTREQGVIVRDKEDKEENHNFVPDDLSGYKYIEKGDFAINKMKAWQGSYAVSDYNGIVSPAYFTCKLKSVNKDFFSKAIRSKVYVPFFTQYSKGIRVGQWDLNPNALKSIPFFLPPVEEQRTIVAYIDEKCQKIDTLMSELQSEIDYMKEYKQRLIADCVTGQVNVQNT